MPGLDQVKLKEVAPTVGIRESRRLDGVCSLEMTDLLDPPQVFADSIAMGSFILDMHPAHGSGAGGEKHPLVANCFQIPYGIMLPRTVDGLLVAGRCVSASREALASIRVMPQAFALGEAAGIAAALCSQQGLQPREIPVREIQARLVAQGAVIA